MWSRVLMNATNSASVDDTLDNSDLRSLALQMRHLRAGTMRFLTAPVRGLGMEGEQSVVYLDERGVTELSRAIGANHAALRDYLASHDSVQLPATPN